MCFTGKCPHEDYWGECTLPFDIELEDYPCISIPEEEQGIEKLQEGEGNA